MLPTQSGSAGPVGASSHQGPSKQAADQGTRAHLGSFGPVGWQRGLAGSVTQSGSSGAAGAAYAHAGTASAGMAISAPTAATFATPLRTPDDIAQPIDRSS